MLNVQQGNKPTNKPGSRREEQTLVNHEDSDSEKRVVAVVKTPRGW
jgi:hypothetical protein